MLISRINKDIDRFGIDYKHGKVLQANVDLVEVINYSLCRLLHSIFSCFYASGFICIFMYVLA